MNPSARGGHLTPVHDRLRIAFVADTMDGLGGGIVSGARFVEALRARHHVKVVSTGASPEIDVRLRGFQLPVRAMREMRFVFARPDRDVLRRAFADVDVVHVQHPFWLGLVAVDVARELGVPVVAAFHVQPENLLYNIGLRWRWLRDALYRLWVRRLYGRAELVIAPSRFAADKLREHGLTTPVRVVSNGANPRLRARRPRRDDDLFTLLAVGRLARDKRQEVIVDAVRRSRHAARIRLVLAGAGPLEGTLRRRARALPRGAEIGWVSQDRLEELYAEADLFVHAGEVELEGMAVVDAVSVGLPALIADSPESAAPGLAAGADMLFAPGDAAGLAARIDALIEDRAQLARAGARALARAAELRFDRSVARLEEVYAAAAPRYRPSSGGTPCLSRTASSGSGMSAQ